MERVKFTQSARRRRIGKAHVLAAMADAGEPMRVQATDELDERLVWIGRDDRGVELEIIGIELPGPPADHSRDALLVPEA